ncbi:hypothetical protein [Maribellus mangrovi]|uniref:hypothetical protein n=1 Tax=Maribellus mangrovi TaxID=3133146 RepID=UPI0030EEB8B4
MSADLYNELMTEFPSSKRKIKQLLNSDENFQEIVEDYLFCKRELEKLSATKSVDITTKYAQTLQDLKEELIARLEQI